MGLENIVHLLDIKYSRMKEKLRAKKMEAEERKTLEEEKKNLEAQLTGDMFQDMDLKDKIHNIKMKLNGTKPTDSHFDCVGCGS